MYRFKLDCGSIIYGSAYYPIDGFRLALGAFRIALSKSLYVDANEPSHSDRRTKLAL